MSERVWVFTHKSTILKHSHTVLSISHPANARLHISWFLLKEGRLGLAQNHNGHFIQLKSPRFQYSWLLSNDKYTPSCNTYSFICLSYSAIPQACQSQVSEVLVRYHIKGPTLAKKIAGRKGGGWDGITHLTQEMGLFEDLHGGVVAS